MNLKSYVNSNAPRFIYFIIISFLMLYIYGTVYNSRKRVLQSLDSIMGIKIEKSIYIVDNYSSDGTFELLQNNQDKYNMVIIQARCTRGWGRYLAIQKAEEKASHDDMFMFIDLDTVYNNEFARLVEYAYAHIDHNTVFLDNHLCYYDVNHAVPWKDLTAAEDVEREARFINLGYKLVYPSGNPVLWENEPVEFDREKRYAKGIEYYKRKSRSAMDVLRGVGCNNMKNLMFFMRNAKVHRRFYPVFTLIFLYVRIFKEIYNYSDDTNIELIRRKSSYIDIQ